MYKIFLNDREIVISSKATEYSDNTEIVSAEGFTIDNIKSWFSEFHQKSNHAVFFHPIPEELMTTSFIPAFRLIQAGGGVVVRNSKLLFIFRNEKWDLPKGKIDNGETPEQTAIREVTEECGITGHSIVRHLPSTYHIYQSPYKNAFGKWILKKTFWFEMSYVGVENGTPETGENITEIKWFEREELGEIMKNTYKNLVQIIKIYS